MLQYERCRLDPQAEFARTCRFLGIDDRFAPPDVRRPVNAERHETPPPDAAARARIAELFEADVAATCAMFPEVDRSLWPDFA